MRKVNNTIIEIIKKEYNAIGCYSLAKTLKLDPKTVYTYAKKFNLPGPSVKFTAEYAELECQTCRKIFKKSKKTITDKHPGKYCSRYCQSTGRRKSNTKINQVLELVKKGLKNREISVLTGYPMGSIGSWLNKSLYRRTDIGTSFNTIRNKFLKGKVCYICGFSRIVEAAHIIPASKGGPNSEDNLLALCPNHHHLFDHNRLLDDEYNKIKSVVELVRKNFNV